MIKMKSDRAIAASSINIHIEVPFEADFTRFCGSGRSAFGSALLKHSAPVARTGALVFLILALAGCATPALPPGTQGSSAPTKTLVDPSAPRAMLQVTDFAALPGWQADPMQAAWPAFLLSCRALQSNSAWSEVCGAAYAMGEPSKSDPRAVRRFFETWFKPYHVTTPSGTDGGVITGYFEPELNGSRVREAPYLTPLYGVPDDLITVDLADVYPELKGMTLRGRLEDHRLVAYPSRSELVKGGAAHAKELVWVDDPIAAFFLQVQGSGRVQLHEGNKPTEIIRLAYADQNGRPYKSIGRWLVDQGELSLDQVSMQSIRMWGESHPDRLQELLDVNPSYVFFREQPLSDPAVGPMGSLGVPLTPGRSIAVDSRLVPLGAPVFLATTEPGSGHPMRLLTIAQDTGGAIKTAPDRPVRADLFWGYGREAGDQAGRMKEQGRMWVLLPLTVHP